MLANIHCLLFIIIIMRTRKRIHKDTVQCFTSSVLQGIIQSITNLVIVWYFRILYAGKTHSKWKSLLHKNSNVSNVVMCPSEMCALPAQLCSPPHKHINRHHNVIEHLSVHMTNLSLLKHKGQWWELYTKNVSKKSDRSNPSSSFKFWCFIRSTVTPVCQWKPVIVTKTEELVSLKPLGYRM